MKPKAFQQAILNWFQQHGRKDLPWQQPITPYPVWISEIMLQQTQVTTVIPYFQRFMESFPSIEQLADASLDQVLHHWSGLGYYARARNLHKTAKQIVSEMHGQFPNDIDQLIKLPGIGRSTAGAIRSIAFGKPAAILDGNVKRVLARFFAVEGWPGNSAVHRQLWEIAEHYTPNQRTANYTQAMMDLGATLCTRTTPDCGNCPLRTHCQAFSQGNPQSYPGKKPKKVLPVKNRIFLLFKNPQGEILLQQNPPAGLWGGLWVLPQIEELAALNGYCHKLGLKPVNNTPLEKRRHSFSHFHLDYQPIVVDVDHRRGRMREGDDEVWYNPQKPLSLATPAPVKALLTMQL